MRILLTAVVAVVSNLVAYVPAGADDGALLLSDDFSELRPAWGSPAPHKQVEKGRLLIKVPSGKVIRVLHDDGKFKDFDARVMVTQVEGEENRPGGIIFWAVDRENHYSALIRSDGRLQVKRRFGGTYLFPVSSSICREIRTGANQANELRVVTSGSKVEILVNGRSCVSFRGFPPPDGGQIGVHAESGKQEGTWAYSELRVRQGTSGPARDEAVLFAEDFSTVDPAWGAADATWDVADGKLLLKSPVGKSFGRIYGGTLLGDADIRVKISRVGSDRSRNDPTAGVIFWGGEGEGNYYYAALRSGGSFTIIRVDDQGKPSVPLPRADYDAVRRGIGQVNELRLVLKGETATVFVNGKKIAAINGFKHPPLFRFGLKASSGDDVVDTWAFSDLMIRRPE
jgi:hypothetical protein